MAQQMDDPKSIVHAFVEEWNKGNLDSVMAFFNEDTIDHNPVPGQGPGKVGVRQGLEPFMQAFPDLKLTTELVVVDGDRVADHGVARGTHKGNLLGIPPTGKHVEFTYSDVYRIKDGKIVEAWHIEDIPAVMQQIGAMKAPGS